jgi:Mlc titration factor MtfA (ptsG expression regulator)
MHRLRAEAGVASLIRDYATINPAEYFACACEVYFEQPAAMRAELPAVYAELAGFFAG